LLEKKGTKTMSVKMIRLINNEEVIGNITEPTGKSTTYTVKNGAVVVPVAEGQLAMVPWLPHAEEKEISVDSSKVILCFTPLAELANEYSTKMGSGLVVPQSAAPAPFKISGSV